MKKYLICILLIVFGIQTAAFAGPELTLNPAESTGPVKSADDKDFAESPKDKKQSSQSLEEESPLSTASASLMMEMSTTGRTYYVSASASTTGTGSETDPYKSVQKAVSMLEPGDILVIREGVYNEAASFKTSGRSEAWITIRGEGNVIFDGEPLLTLSPAFDTKGKDFLRFENLTVVNMRAAVEVSSGSNDIVIDGLRTEGNRFAVRINASSNVTVRNAYAAGSNNAFRAYGASRNLLFENITATGSKDIYDGMDPDYLNGDGFIFEAEVSNVTLRNIVSSNHWDAGFDIKASNVLVENVVAFGNKNNLKLWGKNIVVRNALSYGAKRQLREDGSTVEGNGVTIETGASVKIYNSTFADNEDHDIRIYDDGTLILENSIVSRTNNTGALFKNSGGYFSSQNVMWHNTASSKPSGLLGALDIWANPLFVDREAHNYRTDSPLGYQYATGENPPSEPGGEDPPAEDPEDPAAEEGLTGLVEGQTVQGTINIQPENIAGVKSVTYFIDGQKMTSTGKSPFAYGGSSGLDTRKLKNGAHTLVAIIYNADGEQQAITINFTVQN